MIRKKKPLFREVTGFPGCWGQDLGKGFGRMAKNPGFRERQMLFPYTLLCTASSRGHYIRMGTRSLLRAAHAFVLFDGCSLPETIHSQADRSHSTLAALGHPLVLPPSACGAIGCDILQRIAR
jgi:hypothetical protein